MVRVVCVVRHLHGSRADAATVGALRKAEIEAARWVSFSRSALLPRFRV
jgi:hypothetical protein